MKNSERKSLTESNGAFKRSRVRNRAPSLRRTLLASTCIFLTATTALSDTVVIDGQGLSGLLIDSTLGSTAAPLVIGGGSNPSSALGRYEGGSKTLTTSGSGSTVFTNFSTIQKQNEGYWLFTKCRTFDESTQRMVLEESSVR